MGILEEIKKVPKRAYLFIMINFIIIGLSFYSFSEIADDVLEKEKFMIDRLTRQFVNEISSPTLDRTFSFITDLGSVPFITVSSFILAAFLFFFYERRKWRILYFAVAMIGIGTLTRILKELYERKRPNIFEQYDGTGYSFPSGHSTGPMVFYGFIIYLLIRSRQKLPVKWLVAVPLSLLIIAIGFSRVYLGVHFASDVMAGHFLGLSWLVSCVLILEYTLWKKKR